MKNGESEASSSFASFPDASGKSSPEDDWAAGLWSLSTKESTGGVDVDGISGSSGSEESAGGGTRNDGATGRVDSEATTEEVMSED